MPKSQNLNSSSGQADISRSTDISVKRKRKRKKLSYKNLMAGLTSARHGASQSVASEELMRKKHGLGGGTFEKIQKI